MGLTNFPFGVSSFGMPVVGAGPLMTTGGVYFVDSGAARGSDANAGTSPDLPMATLDGAIGRCTASNGDIIFVMPGHAESVAATDVTCDVAGVSIIGLGHGDNRPTFTFAATGSTFNVTASDVRLSNLIFVPGIAAVLYGITLSSGASGTEIDNCEFKLHATLEFTNMILAVAGADDVVIRDNNFFGLDGTAGATAIRMNGIDRVRIIRNLFQGNFSTGVIEAVTAACMQVTIAGNIIQNHAAAGTITMLTTSTGVITDNRLSTRSTGFGATLFVGADCLCTENYLRPQRPHRKP
jgi:hypothetical protein